MKTLRPGVAAFVAFLACACSSDKPTDPGQQGSIQLSITPTATTIQRNSSAIVTGTIARTNYTGDIAVSISGAPSGVTGSVTQAPTGGSNSLQVTISVGNTAPLGTHTIKVTASGAGVASSTADLALTIAAATPASFSMAMAVATSLVQGGSGELDIDFTRTNFTGNITLALENLPAGVTAAFDPHPVSGNNSVVTLTASPSAVPGTYTSVLLRGTATGLTDVTLPLTITITVAGNFSIGAANPTLNIVRGNNATTAITATRTGGFNGTISYTVTGPAGAALPAGLVATIAPSATADEQTLTVTTAAPLAAGTYPVVVHATTPGLAEQTTTVNVVVTVGSFTIASEDATVNIVRGSSAISTITATRVGGFTGDISYSVTGPSNAALPAGLTAALAASGTADQQTLTIGTTDALTPGTYPIVVHATSPDVAEQTATIDVVVTSSSAPATVTLDYSRCYEHSRPTWMAYQDGSGDFVRVMPVGDVYTFDITSETGAVATVFDEQKTEVKYFAKSEAATEASRSSDECSVMPVNGKSISGIVAGGGNDNNVTVSMGGVRTQFGDDMDPRPHTLVGVEPGPKTLLAYRFFSSQGPMATDRYILRHNVDLPDGGSFGTLDFDGADARVPTEAELTVDGYVASDNLQFNPYLLTGQGCQVQQHLYQRFTDDNVLRVSGIHDADMLPSQLHWMQIRSAGPFYGVTRIVELTARTFANGTVTLPTAPTPTSIAAVPGAQSYRLMQATMPMPAMYQSARIFYQNFLNSFMVEHTPGYIAGAPMVTLTAVDLTSVPGYNVTWAPVKGSTQTLATIWIGRTGDGECTAGALRYEVLLRQQVPTP